ncbi:MAG: hypothetical protein ABIK28_00475 [Planctomycetota bacterium]
MNSTHNPQTQDENPPANSPACALPTADRGKAWTFILPFLAAGLFLYFGTLHGGMDEQRLPRGDVAIDAGVAASLARGLGFWTPWSRGTCYHLSETETRECGHAADQHPPLWPLVGSALIRLFDASPLQALEWASFIAHLAVLWLIMRLGPRLGTGRWTFLPALAWALISVGSAFSFNASLYTAQAGFYLAFVLLASREKRTLLSDLMLGCVMGGAWLLNYQSILLVPAFLIARFLCQGKAMFRARSLAVVIIPLAAAVLVASPWLARNALIFGDPLYSVNHWYLLSKVGASFSHTVANGRLVLEAEPLSLVAYAKGMLHCAWLNIPYLLLLLLALFPGCLVVFTASGPCLRHALFGKERKPLVIALFTVIALHLTSCLIWPALKVRYLVPVGPLVVTWAVAWAWQQSLGIRRLSRKSLLLGAFAAGLLCLAVWLKGSVHGKNLFLSFMVSYLTLSLVYLAATLELFADVRSKLPLLGLCALFLAAVGVYPGQAYFNIPPFPDFFGQDKDQLHVSECMALHSIYDQLEEISKPLEASGTSHADGLIGDLRLWHITPFSSPSLTIMEPPKLLPGENYLDLLRTAAEPFKIGYAVIEPERASLLPEIEPQRIDLIVNGWILIDLFP